MIGRTLTHYKVVEELGAGGMGVVYKALDLRLDRYVALKILPPDRSHDDDRRARFLHEARAASALNDPHIVTIFDIFTDEGTDVLVMEFVQGRTLRDVLDGGPMAVATALDIAVQVAEGVGTAHNAGIVHRDLKPGNVMVNERGRVKVLDFGLAKLVASGAIADQPTISSPTTVAGMLLGTVDYMSPEQAKGDPIDGRTDVFSLGAMLYEMLTGARPFVSGHPLGVLHEILYGTVVPMRTKRPEISADVEAAVQRALERDLANRYPTMEAFATDLRRAVRDADTRDRAAVVASPPVTPPPLPSQSPRPAAAEQGSAQPAPSERATPQPAVSRRVNVQPIDTGGADVRPAVSERFGAQANGTTERPVTPVATTVPPPSPLPGVSSPDAWSRARRRDRPPKSKRKVWKTTLTVIAILWAISWIRDLTRPSRITVPRRPAVSAQPTTDPDRIGTAVEDAVASALNGVGANSAGIQLARGKIYWSRAQKNGDASLTKKAEDAFSQVLRLDPDDDEAQEARKALREIAEAKATVDNHPSAVENPPNPPKP